MVRQVLVPTDGSAAALEAGEAIAGLLQGYGDVVVTVLAVVSYVDPSEAECGQEFVKLRNDLIRTRAETETARLAQVFEAKRMRARTRILDGDPVSVIIAAEANEGGYDMIAMGSRGLSLEKDRLSYVGSVAQHVIRRVRLPVLIIPIGD